MQLVRRHFNLRSKAIIASLLVALVLLLDAMAACPGLHELIHHDAGQPEHQCAVTLFAHGKVDSTTVEVAVVLPTVFVEITSQSDFSVFVSSVENLPTGRGPPTSLLYS